MPSAEIIAIGTELLLGEIQDTNTRFLARALRDHGIDLYRTMMVGDNPQRIAQAIRESLQRSQIVITTGGLGPTVDDPTRDAVALALNMTTVFVPELWEQIQARFRRFNRVATENNRRQAYIPAGSTPLENPVGTAPAFICDTGPGVIISLPGVPREMEYLTEHAVLPFLRQRFSLTGTIQTYLIHVAGMGESQVDDLVGDLETIANPTVGLAAHAGVIDVRLTAKADSISRANSMLQEMALEVKTRLGDAIYGYNEDTLEAVVGRHLTRLGLHAVILESGLNGELLSRLQHLDMLKKEDLRSLPTLSSADELKDFAGAAFQQMPAVAVLAVRMEPGEWQQNMDALWLTAGQIETLHRSYGGPAAMGPAWCVNTALDFCRRMLQNKIESEHRQ